jgi:hypothetical protein
MSKYGNFFFRNNQDRCGISYHSRHFSCAKESHLVASPVKLIFYGFPFFYKGRGEMNFLDA